MSVLPRLFDLRAAGADTWVAPACGPKGKRAFGGQLAAQALAAAGRTVDDGESERATPTNLHVQFLRAGEAGEPVEYAVERMFDGRTTASRRVRAYQRGRLLTTTTLSFAAAAAGPEHWMRLPISSDPEQLDQTGPAGSAPAMPLNELDIRVTDDASTERFVRQLWWRATAMLPPDLFLHTCVAVFVTDAYMIDPAFRVNGHAVRDPSRQIGVTTDSSIWFHRPVRADRWNLLESISPAAAQGRGVVTANMVDAEGTITATLVQEGRIIGQNSETARTAKE